MTFHQKKKKKNKLMKFIELLFDTSVFAHGTRMIGFELRNDAFENEHIHLRANISDFLSMLCCY